MCARVTARVQLALASAVSFYAAAVADTATAMFAHPPRWLGVLREEVSSSLVTLQRWSGQGVFIQSIFEPRENKQIITPTHRCTRSPMRGPIHPSTHGGLRRSPPLAGSCHSNVMDERPWESDGFFAPRKACREGFVPIQRVRKVTSHEATASLDEGRMRRPVQLPDPNLSGTHAPCVQTNKGQRKDGRARRIVVQLLGPMKRRSILDEDRPGSGDQLPGSISLL